jgi:CBS domain-containing protein
MKSIKAILGARETFTVDRRASVRDAARLMAERRIGGLPVVDDGRLVGIVTERDVLTRVVAVGRNPDGTIVGDIMTSELIVAESGEAYDVCLTRMQQSHIRHLIVLDNGALAGIASLRDMLAADLEEKSEAITLLNAYVHYIPVDLQKLRG